jgi:nicotinic acid phosphoribosyltransferase
MRVKKMLAAAVVVASLSIGGAAIAGAATSTSTTTTTSSATAPTASQTAMPAHGTAAHEDAEKAVTGDAATKAQAAAVKEVGSGTAGAVTTDFTGNGYEVTVTKSDGSTVEVHLDSSFTVMQMPGGPPPSH